MTEKIEKLKDKLCAQIQMNNCLTDTETVALSQELDKLLNEYTVNYIEKKREKFLHSPQL